MKSYQLTKEKLEAFVKVFGEAIYSAKGWDKPTIILLDSVGECEALYQKLLNPRLTEENIKENKKIDKIATDFWVRNGHKYNWNFFANKVNYNEGTLVSREYPDSKHSYLYQSSQEYRSGNLSELCDTVKDVLINHEELFVETLLFLSLPENLSYKYLIYIIKAIVVEELLDCSLINHLCIFCRPPILFYNSQRRLHHSIGPAIEFPNGESYYYWNGWPVSKQWIVNPEEVTRKDLLSIHNVEDRRVLHEILGDDKFSKLLDLKVTEIDSYNSQDVYLMCTSNPDITTDEYLYFIKVICNSTGRRYHICIPENAYNLGAIGALAWTFGMESTEYQLLIET